MSWSIRRLNVLLRVTRFEPEQQAPLPAGLTPQQREAFRAKRERECRKVEPAIDLDADLGSDEPDTYDDYTADPRGDYADSVGMRLRD